MSVRALGRQSLVYGFGHILSRIITFLLLPLYTHVFTPDQYGVVSLAYAFIGFALILYHYGTDTALLKFYSDAADQKSNYLSIILTLQAGSGLLFSLGLIGLRHWLTPILLGTEDDMILILVAGILFFDTLWSLAAIVLRSEEKPFSFVGLSLINVLGTLGLNILFVVYLKAGIRGVLFSNLIISGFLVLICLPLFLRRLDLKSITKPIVNIVLRFAIPFLPAGIFTMVLELSNRYFLNWLTDTATVGIYSAGYKLGMFGLLIVMGFNMGWSPYFLKQRNNPDALSLFARITKYFMGVQGFITLILVLWIDDLVRFNFAGNTFFGQEFWGATGIVPIILLGYMFFALYTLQLPSVYHTDQTRWVPFFRGIGAAVCIILNLALIPLLGIIGSALASLIAYASMSASMYIKTRKAYPIPYNIPGLAFPFVFVAAAIFLPSTIAIKLLTPLGYLLLWGFFILTKAERRSILRSR